MVLRAGNLPLQMDHYATAPFRHLVPIIRLESGGKIELLDWRLLNDTPVNRCDKIDSLPLRAGFIPTSGVRCA